MHWPIPINRMAKRQGQGLLGFPNKGDSQNRKKIGGCQLSSSCITFCRLFHKKLKRTGIFETGSLLRNLHFDEIGRSWQAEWF